MDQRVKKAYFEEIEYQTKQINRLKIWLKFINYFLSYYSYHIFCR